MIDPTTLTSAVLSVLLTLPSTWSERWIETQSERAARMSVYAHATARHSRTLDEAAALVTLGQTESTFARYVELGCVTIPKGASGDCDRISTGPRRGQIRARSAWQLWRVACPSLWRLPVGSREAIDTAASCAVRRWRAAKRRCASRAIGGDQIAGAFSGYRSIRCDWGPSVKRAAEYRRVLRALRAAYAEVSR